MTRFVASVALNLDSRFGPFEPGHRVYPLGRFVVEAPSLAAAFEKVYSIGNRMEDDAEGRSWSSDVRSLSVGDVVGISTTDVVGEAEWSLKAVASFGFQPIPFDFQPATREEAIWAGAIRA